MGVDSSDGDGTLPLMMHLVEVFIQHTMVEQSKWRERERERERERGGERDVIIIYM